MEEVNVSSPHDMHFGIEPHPLYGNNKKVLMEHNATADSGYVTNWSISHNHTATSSFTSSKLGSPRSSFRASTSGSFKQLSELETIAENLDSKSLNATNAETPTTRNIRQLSEFHINTPQNNNHRNQLETTPKKTNYFQNNISSGSLSGRKKTRFSWGPYESPKSKRNSGGKIKTPNKRSTLFDSNDENVCDRSDYISPIKSHNNSNIMQIQNSPRIVQRHPSGIGTSTPKFTLRRTQTHSLIQLNKNDNQDNNLMRKIKSFNPPLRHQTSTILKESNAQNRQDSVDFLEEIDDSPSVYNPAKKMLAFTSEQFEQLIQPSSSTSIKSLILPKTPAKTNTVGTLQKLSGTPTMSPRKLANVRSQSRLIREFARKETMRPTLIQSKTSTVDESTEMIDISKSSYSNGNETNDMMDENLSFFDELKQFNNASILNLKELKTDTPTRNDSISLSIREEANRTPTKRFEHCISYDCITTRSSPEKEKNKILYHNLPCTPPKTYVRRPLKRQASSLLESATKSTVEPQAKRKLYDYRIERDTFYDGMEYLDILKHLSTDFKMAQVTEKILNHLSGKDLHAASCVSKDWMDVIVSCKESRNKRRKYIKESEIIKENLFETSHSVSILNTANHIMNDTLRRKPFHLHNEIEEISFEAPLSPRSKRFREHQKLVDSLMPNQRLMRCDTCDGICIVTPVSIKSQTPMKQCTDRRTTKITRTNQMFAFVDNHSIPKREDAVCQKCAKNFCVNCKRQPHGNTECTENSIGNLSEDDDLKPIRPKKGKKRSNLLKRLAF